MIDFRFSQVEDEAELNLSEEGNKVVHEGEVILDFIDGLIAILSHDLKA